MGKVDLLEAMTRGSKSQILARRKLLDLFQRRPMSDDVLLAQFELYVRSSVLAKLLFINEIYQLVLPIPGVIMEFGVWYGRNLCLFSELRAVYEPYNYARRVIGFDTWGEGYTEPGMNDNLEGCLVEGSHPLSSDYIDYLTELLDYHEAENVNSHIKKYELVKGDAIVTVPEYLKRNPETIIALAFFDLGLYAPTRACLEAIGPHLIKGSVLAMDELNCRELPGETVALREIMGLDRHKIYRSRFVPDRSYLIYGG